AAISELGTVTGFCSKVGARRSRELRFLCWRATKWTRLLINKLHTSYQCWIRVLSFRRKLYSCTLLSHIPRSLFMSGKQAKVLSEDDVKDLLVYASAGRNPLRNRVMVLLSAKAGLRAGEIA